MLIPSLPSARRLNTLKIPLITILSNRAASINSAIRKGSRKSALAGERRQAPPHQSSRSARQAERKKFLLEYNGARSSRREDKVSAISKRSSGRTGHYNRPLHHEDRASSTLEQFGERTGQYERPHQNIRHDSHDSTPSNPEYERRASKFREALRGPPKGRSGPNHPEPDYLRRGPVLNGGTRSPTRHALGGAHDWERPRGNLGKRDYEAEHFTIDGEDEVPSTTPKTRRHFDPISIPYTTPASEFLYGTSVVRAALKARRRKLYKLYIYTGENRVDLTQDRELRTLAESISVDVRQVRGDWLRVMDKMSKGRPHNGYILEASPLPQLPVRSLHSIEEKASAFGLQIDHQSREEEEINGGLSSIRCQTKSRYPVVLLLDGVVDPGNLGAVLRTAYFFGIDAVAIAKGNNAPIGPVAQKASSGAVENLQMLSVSDPGKFVEQSQENGWRFYAAVAPNTHMKRQQYSSSRALAMPAKNGPCVLMVGGEGEGLRSFLQTKADSLVGIEGDRLGRGGVDSLNVSVAAGILCDAFSQSSDNVVKDKYRERPATLQHRGREAREEEESSPSLF